MSQLNRKLHRWLGLALAVFLAFQGLTGAFLHYGGDIDRWLNPGLDPPGYRAAAPRFDAVIEAVGEVAPDGEAIFIDAPRAERNSYRVVLDNALGDRLYLHPETLTLQLRRGAFAEPVDLVEALHTGALAGEWLGVLLGLVGVLAIPLIVTGLIRWWPGLRRVPRALRIRSRNALQLTYTSHRALGAVITPVLLFLVVTGAALSLHDWVHESLSALTGQPPRPERPQAAGGETGVLPSIDKLAVAARARTQGASPQFVILPRKPGQPVVFRLRHEGEWHPSGRSEVYFHPQTGELLGAYVLDERNGTQRFLDGLYPLHIAAPLGEAGRALWAAAGIGMAFFSISGVFIWWYRYRPRDAGRETGDAKRHTGTKVRRSAAID